MTLSNVGPGSAARSRLPEAVDSAEAIVVGTGFGGAVTACRLKQAGFDVLVLERGRRYEAGDFPTMPSPSALMPDPTRWTWQQSQGLWDILDLEEVVSVQAAGYGGGSLIYANVHLRAPDAVFDERWPEVYRNGAGLKNFYDLAAYMLDVAPIDAHPKLGDALIKTDQLRKVARQLGRENGFFHPPLAVSFKDGTNVHGREQKACTGCGACSTGCPETAKNTLDFNYLAVAEKRGARVVTQCEVIEIEQLDDGRWRLDCLNHLTAERRAYVTTNLFLCAGSVQSTRLLARTRLQERSKAVKSMVGIGYFPNADAMGVIYDTTHPQFPSFGPTITTTTVCSGSDAGSFFLLQDGGYARGLERLIGTLRAPAWVGRNRITKAGMATVDRGSRPPPPSPVELASAPPLMSPLDGVLAAVSGGGLAAMSSAHLRNEWKTFLDEVKDPLLLPAIVDRTIETAFRALLQRSFLTSWIAPDGSLFKLIMRVNKWIIRRIYGSSASLADDALQAMLNAASLPRADVAKRILGYANDQADHRVMLLAMGRDKTPGVLHYDGKRDRLVADLDLYHLAPRYSEEERLMADVAKALGGELRTNPAWAFLGKPITVHSQGGCPMSERPDQGVTNENGQVHGCHGLYVLDGSILCTSVGVNPSATITAIAERNILEFIRRHKGNQNWPEDDRAEGALEYANQRARAAKWAEEADKKKWMLLPPVVPEVRPESKPLGLKFDEVMQGYYSPTAIVPLSPDDYRAGETTGRPAFPMKLTLEVSVENLVRFFEDYQHEMSLVGSVTIRLPDEPEDETFDLRGTLNLLVERQKPYGIAPSETTRRAAQERLAATPYTTSFRRPKPRPERVMTYSVSFCDRRGRTWMIDGQKIIRDDPGLDVWRDTSSLFVSLRGPEAPPKPGETNDWSSLSSPLVFRGAGVIHVDLDGFMFRQMPSLRIIPEDVDRARAMWARLKFGTFFFGQLQRVYAPEARAAVGALFKPHSNNVQTEQPKFGS